MEIKDYVGALAGRGRIVAAVAIVVGFLAVVLYILQPQRYQATATVVIPTPGSTTTSAIAAVSQAYADFSGALSSQEVAEKAAQAVDVPTSDVTGHLSSSRLAGSRLAEVTYSGTNRDLAPKIAQAASQAALEIVASADLAALQQQQTLAEQDNEDAITAYQQFVAQSTILNPTRYFATEQNHMTNLRRAIGAAENAGDDTEVTRLQGVLDSVTARVSEYAGEYKRVTFNQQTAEEALSAAQAAYLTQQGLVNSMNTGSQVSVSDPRGAPRLSGLIKAVVPAVVVATGLAIAMIVLFEVVGPVRLPVRGRDGDDGDKGGPEAAAEEADEAEHGEAADGAEGSEPEEPERDPAGRPVRTRA